MEKASYKRFVHVGPGGVKCRCCFEVFGKARKAEFRRAKKRERNNVKQEVFSSLLAVD